MPLEVIGASFARTGTSSLREALEILGYPCYHMSVVRDDALGSYFDTTRINSWLLLAKGEKENLNWDATFRHYTAAVDFPASYFYKELLQKYPNAKIVFNNREFESWYRSASDTVCRMHEAVRQYPWYAKAFLLPFYRLHMLNDDLIWYGEHSIFKGKFADKEYIRNLYESHIAEVKKVVPEKQLLMFDLKQGWSPLCTFLGKEVPNVPFPNINDTKEFHEGIKKAKTLLSFFTYGLPVIALLLVCVTYDFVIRHSLI